MAKARETKANPSIRANSAHIEAPKPTPTRKAVAIVRSEQAKEAVKVRDNPSSRLNQPTRSITPTRKAVAIEAKLPERKIRLAQEIKKVDPAVSAMVRAGDISLVEGAKICRCSAPSEIIHRTGGGS